jgi:hypothetical protein
MGIDFESVQDVLKHPIRRQIILSLNANPNLSYMDLMNIVETKNTGKFNYHLKVLADLIEKDANGRYMLTEKGRLAAQFLETFKRRKIASPNNLRMTDALLIGFAGFVLTFANPFFYGLMYATAFNSQSYPLFLSWLFALIVPGAMMWRFAVRRSGSHSAYDIFKAPLITFLLLLPIFVAFMILMLTSNVNFFTEVSIPIDSHHWQNQNTTWGYSHEAVFNVGFPGVVYAGMVYSFAGVAIAEFASRVRKKIALRK